MSAPLLSDRQGERERCLQTRADLVKNEVQSCVLISNVYVLQKVHFKKIPRFTLSVCSFMRNPEPEYDLLWPVFSPLNMNMTCCGLCFHP